METKIKGALSWALSIMMVLGLFITYPILVRAEDKPVTIKLSCQAGMEVPENYGIDFDVYNSGGSKVRNGVVNGTQNGSLAQETVSVPDGGKLKIQVRSAGADIFYNGSADNEWSNGKEIAASALATEYAFVLQPSSQGGPGQGPGGEQGGGGNQQEETINLTVTWSGGFGEIKIGNHSIDGIESSQTGSYPFTSAKVQNDDTIEVVIQAPFSENYSSIKLNDVEKFTSSASDGRYVFSIPKDTTSLSIVVVKAVQTQGTIVWAYDNSMGADALVENGTVELISGGTGNPGHYLVDYDATVTIKLIPAYGYQVVGARINGDVDLTAGSEPNTFTFAMPHTNVHFQGIFTQTADIVENSSTGISGATFSGDKVATSGGTAKMTLSNASPADYSSLPLEIDSEKPVTAVDISMDQLFYKNTASDVWSTNKTELASAATVNLTVTQPAEAYAVLRTHNGNVESVSCTYNRTTHILSFASDKYSTYTLVPIKQNGSGGGNNYGPSEELPSVTPSVPTPAPAPEPQAPMAAASDFGGKVINSWNDLEEAILDKIDIVPVTAAASEKVVAKEPIKITLSPVNATVPAEIFKTITKTQESGIHFFAGKGTALTFVNDGKLSNQKAVNLACTTEESATGRVIKFKESGSLEATAILHSVAPKDAKSVEVNLIYDNGDKKLVSKSSPTPEGRFCFEIKELGEYKIDYIR